jgi:hypothetical protein
MRDWTGGSYVYADRSDNVENVSSSRNTALSATRGRGGRKICKLLKHIGSAPLTELKLVGRVEVREKPELLLEHPELDPLFFRLQSEFELNDRFCGPGTETGADFPHGANIANAAPKPS